MTPWPTGRSCKTSSTPIRFLRDSSTPAAPLNTINSQTGLCLNRSFPAATSAAAELDLNTPSLRARVTNLIAHYELANGDATLQRMQASLLGGTVTASGKMTAIGGNSHTQLDASLKNISLADAKRMVPSKSPQPVAISGSLNATAKAAWGKTLDDLVANVDANIAGRVLPTAKAAQVSSNFIPVTSMIHGVYHGANQQLQLNQTYLRTPQTNLSLNGLLSDRSNLNLRLQCEDMHELETIANLFRTPQPGQPLQPLGLAGTASFDGAVTGSLKAPHLTGNLLATNFQVHGNAVKLLRTSIDVSPSSASLQHAEIQPASRGRITFSATTGLNHWAFTNTSPVQVQLDANQLDINELTKIAGSAAPVSGTLNASIHVQGTELNPVGNGSINLTGVKAYDEPIQSVKLTFNGTGSEVHGDLAVNLPAGNLTSKVSVRPQQKTYTAQVSTAGIHLDQLQALKARNIDVTGVLALNGSGQGSFDDPQGEATLQIPQLVVQKQTITGLNLHLNVANHLANASLTTSAVNTSIRANARVNLTGDYLADASLDTQGIPFQPLVAIYAPAQAGLLNGQTEIHATLHGPLKNTDQLEAHLTIPTLRVPMATTSSSPPQRPFMSTIRIR